MSTVTKTTRPPITISIPEARTTEQSGPDTQDMSRQKPDLSGAARQADIAELNRRISERLAKLPKEFATQSAKSQAEANARIDKLETQLDRLGTTLEGLEGALRIELAPYLGTTVAEAMKDHAPRSVRRGRGGIAILFLMLGVALGAGFHGPLLGQASAATDLILSHLPGMNGR
jgi:hypothetical protein